jgi:hypothetical protein
VNAYLSEPNYLESTLKYSGQQKEQIEQILSYLVTNKPLTFDECIIWARLQFEEKYGNEIKQLLFSLPKDGLTSTGQPFWSGPKRAPDPLVFNSNDVRFRVVSVFLKITQLDDSSPCTSNTSSRLPIFTPSTMGSGAKPTQRYSERSPTPSLSQSLLPRAESRFRSTRTSQFPRLVAEVTVLLSTLYVGSNLGLRRRTPGPLSEAACALLVGWISSHTRRIREGR